MDNSSDYEKLIHKLRRIHTLGTVGGLLSWDEQVNLPVDSCDQRAEQLGLMAELHHAASIDPQLGDLLKALESGKPLSENQAVVVREARKNYDRLTKLPAELASEKAKLCSEGYHVWAAAKAANNFPAFAPILERHIELAKKEAALLGWNGRTYDYLIDQYDPGFDAETIRHLFQELKDGLLPIVRAILQSPIKPPTDLFHGYPIEAQRDFLRDVTEKIGFNYKRGRMDVSLHPFCEGSGADIRMTTRFDADNPLDSLFSSIHETGHGLYEQGLPASGYGTALGIHAGMGAHESQSRLWENQVARSRAFWDYFEPRFREKFPSQLTSVSSERLYLAINAVEPTLIRVDADEVTYNLHILLRFELEQKLFSGDLVVQDLPRAWNALAKELLDLTPPSDAKGVLQDVHWSGGAFGYFPSYCLGNMIAAQLWYTALDHLPGLEGNFMRGDFSSMLDWLRKNFHAQGRRMDARSLVKAITGTDLSPKHLLRYLKERYLPLYAA